MKDGEQIESGLLLAMDTATEIASLALYDGRRVLAERSWPAGRRHTIELTPNVIDLLAQVRVSRRDIQALAVAQGPGSFTGLRIGMSMAKGLATALGIPIVAVPTLHILAYAHYDQPLPIRPVIQAGRGRLCYTTFRHVEGQWRQKGDYQLTRPEQLGKQVTERTLFCGELGRTAIAALEKNAGQMASIARPAASLRRAGYLAELAWDRWQEGEMAPIEALSPIYLQVRET